MTQSITKKLAAPGVVLALLCALPATAQQLTWQDWLERMTSAVETSNYEGTVIRIQGGNVEALKVTRQISDGVIREKVVMQDGNGLELVRNGNEVQCILPDEQSVTVEEWNDQSRLFSSLPSGDIRFGNEYDPAVVDREFRVAGRKAVLLAIRPHDEYRYGHRIWLDIETGFPLQTRLEYQGELIEHVKFADISFYEEARGDVLTPTTRIDNFRWFTETQRKIQQSVASAWQSHDLPAGFRAISTHEENLAGRDTAVTHILYSDGLANVSVFIEPAGETRFAQRSRVGASNSYSVEVDGFNVTAVGEVPAATVEKIAVSMRPD